MFLYFRSINCATNESSNNAGFFAGYATTFQVDIRLFYSIRTAPTLIGILAIIGAWLTTLVDLSGPESRQNYVRFSELNIWSTHLQSLAHEAGQRQTLLSTILDLM